MSIRDKVTKAYQKKGDPSLAEVASDLKLDYRQVSNAASQLAKIGVLDRVGRGEYVYPSDEEIMEDEKFTTPTLDDFLIANGISSEVWEDIVVLILYYNRFVA